MSWYKGTNHIFSLTIYDEGTTSLQILNGTATCRNVVGWTTRFDMRDDVENPVVTLTKAGSVVGVFNASPALNTQRIEIVILDTDTDNLQARDYVIGLKRMDAGSEWILLPTTKIALLETPVR